LGSGHAAELSGQLEISIVDLEPRPASVRPPASLPAARHIPLWARIVADPGYAAEHAAREAIWRLGPEAHDWVARARRRYPNARSDAMARLASKEAARAARRHGAGTGAAGPMGSVAAIGMLAGSQARLVLTIAAAYDFDPNSEERVRDLLVLLRIPRLTQPTFAALRNAGRVVSGYATRRVAAKFVPFGAAIAGAVQGGRSTDDLATRAIALFRARTSPPDS
jgi:hypothetical protein